MKWNDFYKDKLENLEEYKRRFNHKYLPFLEICKYYIRNLPEPVKIQELGSGIGVTAELLQNKIIDVPHELELIDNDYLMIYHSTLRNIKAEFTIKDILSLNKRCDFAYSHGVLEHFTDIQLRFFKHKAITDHKVSIHYVPTDKYEYPHKGDERLCSKEWWEEKLEPDKTFSFNNQKDLILIWTEMSY